MRTHPKDSAAQELRTAIDNFVDINERHDPKMVCIDPCILSHFEWLCKYMRNSL